QSKALRVTICSSHYQQSWFGHFLNGVANAFTPKARILYSAVRHGIDAECGHVPYNHSAHFKTLESAEDQAGIISKKTGLKPIMGLIRNRERILEIVIWLNGSDGREYLFAIHFHLGRGSRQQSGL